MPTPAKVKSQACARQACGIDAVPAFLSQWWSISMHCELPFAVHSLFISLQSPTYVFFINLRLSCISCAHWRTQEMGGGRLADRHGSVAALGKSLGKSCAKLSYACQVGNASFRIFEDCRKRGKVIE